MQGKELAGYLRDVGPSRWLLVVLSYEQEPARPISAFPNRKDVRARGEPGTVDMMETQTHLFTFPIETDAERAAVEAALEKLSHELALTHALRLKGGHRSMITVPDVGPEDTWSAIDRVVPDWQQLFQPRSAV
jgi:hypothetical protein